MVLSILNVVIFARLGENNYIGWKIKCASSVLQSAICNLQCNAGELAHAHAQRS